MISKKIREEFEANYPMPFACGWNSMTNEYECIWYEHAGGPDIEVPILQHNDRLAVWLKSRESVVVQLPNTECFGEFSEETARVMRDGCADAIAESGLKYAVNS